jgi:predicted Zn-dependent protease
MLGKDRALQLLEETLAHAEADQTEVLLIIENTGLTRFANSAIHQNLAESNARVAIRSVVGKRVGSASTNRLEPEQLRAAADRSLELARLQAENPDFVSLPAPQPLPQVRAISAATDASTPEARAAVVADIVSMGQQEKCAVSGVLSVESTEVVVGNSLGIRAYHPATVALLNVIASDDTSSGYAHWMGTDISRLDHKAIAWTALEKCILGRRPAALDPGDYEVILEPPAVADLVSFLAYLGFGANAVEEGRSFMCDRFGSPITGEQISIWDDGLDPRGLPMPFDFEGVPKQRVELINQGVANAVVYDSYHANKQGKQSTGHALPAPNTYGPYPLNLFLAPGGASREDLIRATRRGLLVTRFHYTNIVQPKETVITGMTRDGTFLIENGRLGQPVRNLRFTQSILDALSSVELVGKEAVLTDRCVVPALKLARFTFTS